MQIRGRHTAVFGLKHTGKSNLVQRLMTMPAFGRSHLVYDVCKEHGPLNSYHPTHRTGDEAREELNEVTSRMITGQDREMRPDVFVIEEVSRFCTAHKRPPSEVYELVDLSRHYSVGLLTVARRPAQVHSDLVDLADHVIYFRLKGKNDRRELNRTIGGLGDLVADLPEYNFAHVTPTREVHVHDPVPEMETTGEL